MNKDHQHTKQNKIHVLICEDNKTEELILQASLGDLGDLEMERFATRADIENRDPSAPDPDLIITDLLLPDAKDDEVLDAIQERYPSTYTIVMSAQQDFDLIEKIQNRGFLHYLIKTQRAIDNLRKLAIILIKARKLEGNQEK